MVDPIRFEDDKSGYFFVYQKTVNVALPPKKEGPGYGSWRLQGQKRRVLRPELEARPKAEVGFVEYIFPKPGQGDQPKSGTPMIPGRTCGSARACTSTTSIGEKALIASTIENKTQSILTAIPSRRGRGTLSAWRS
jgi:methyl-accepting chemotaxis protein